MPSWKFAVTNSKATVITEMKKKKYSTDRANGNHGNNDTGMQLPFIYPLFINWDILWAVPAAKAVQLLGTVYCCSREREIKLDITNKRN